MGQKYPYSQVMAIFARSPKTRIFWKSVKGGTREIFQKSPKSGPHFKGLKALWRKWHYPLNTMRVKCNNRRRFRRKQRLQKCPNGQVTTIFARSPKTRIFWKSSKGGPSEIFQNSPKKKSPRLKGPKALWRKWHYPLTSMHLTVKTGKHFGANSAPKSARMAKIWQFSEAHPKAAFSEKVQRGD